MPLAVAMAAAAFGIGFAAVTFRLTGGFAFRAGFGLTSTFRFAVFVFGAAALTFLQPLGFEFLGQPVPIPRLLRLAILFASAGALAVAVGRRRRWFWS